MVPRRVLGVRGRYSCPGDCVLGNPSPTPFSPTSLYSIMMNMLQKPTAYMEPGNGWDNDYWVMK